MLIWGITERGFKKLFKIKDIILFLKSLIISLHIYKNMKIFPENRFVHILAAAFQVAAGIHVGKLLSISDATQFFWCSDHCVIVRTAILLKALSTVALFCAPWAKFWKTSSVRDRSIFDFVYAENELQKKVFLAGIQN